LTNRWRGGRTIALISVVGVLLTGCSFFNSSRDIDPCSLVTDSELSAYGDYGEPERRDRGNQRICTWYNSTTQPLRTTVTPQLNIYVNHKQRYYTAGQNDVETGYAAGRRYKVRTTDSTCTVTMPVFKNTVGSKKKKGTVDIAVTMPDPKDNCPTARKIAEIVSPRLH
jgi:hypothetical protein